jgi:hypothetical protein
MRREQTVVSVFSFCSFGCVGVIGAMVSSGRPKFSDGEPEALDRQR